MVGRLFFHIFTNITMHYSQSELLTLHLEIFVSALRNGEKGDIFEIGTWFFNFKGNDDYNTLCKRKVTPENPNSV